jgi:tetratricopeptide (TPR) repeat protein
MSSLLRISLIIILVGTASLYGNRTDDLVDTLNYDSSTKPEIIPRERIYRKGDILFLTGKGIAAKLNNHAASLFLEGDYEGSKKLFLHGLKREGLFFPFQYNLGMVYYYQADMKRSMIHFKKAKDLAPYYSKTYIQIGNVYRRMGKEDYAIDFYRIALRKNRKELETFVAMGDIYLGRKQYKQALKFYNGALEYDKKFPDGLIGKARVLFFQEKYIQSIVLLKSVNTKGEYNKALHYYLAEASYKLRDYKTAAQQYAKLLTFKNDRFFLEVAKSLVEYKLKLSKRFLEIE